MQRVIIVILAVMVSLPVYFKSRASGIESTPAAFSVSLPPKVLVKVSGNVRHAGIYEVSANALTGDVINMAVSNAAVKRLEPGLKPALSIANGSALNLKILHDGTGVITLSSMSVNEKILLKVPLDINSMTETDFDLIPGVGPVMARRIFEYRQKNGGSMAVKELLAVDGIGENKYQKLCKYF